MVDREIIAARLSKLREALRKLREIALKPREEYLSSETAKALSEHFLRISLEAVLDMGNHVIASRGFRKPLHLREIPLILGENGIISRDLAERLSRAAGLRNLLVHGYTEVDHDVLYIVLNRDMADLESFAAAIGALCADR